MRLGLIISILMLAPAALADDAPGATGPDAAAPEKVGEAIATDADTQAAKKVLTDYLDLLVKKKWKDAAKLVHPKTLEVVAGVKKRTGKEQHAMAPQFW